jgi:hypothetical protein
MSTHNAYRFRLLGFAFLAAMLATATADAQTAKPRYGFKKGQAFGYDVKITWTYPDHTDTKKGITLYEVASVDKDQIELSVHGFLTHEDKIELKPEMFHLGSLQISRTVIIDPRGEVIETRGSLKELDELMDYLETVVFQRLPEGNEKQWHTEDEISIVRTWMHDPAVEFRQGVPAKDRVDYQFDRTEGDLAWITRTHRIATKSELDPYHFNLDATGRFAFDTQRGLVASLSTNYNISTKVGAGANPKIETFTAVVECRAFDDAELTAILEKIRIKKADPTTRKKALAAIHSRNLEDIVAGIALAGSFARDDKPDDFAKPLAKLLNPPKTPISIAAAAALAVWATPTVEAEAIEAMQNADRSAKQYYVNALAAVGTENAALALAEQAEEFSSDTMVEALTLMGPAAEKAAIGMLRADNHVRATGCEVLAVVGGPLSAVVLERFVKSSQDGYVLTKAEKALTSIKKRVPADEIAEAAQRITADEAAKTAQRKKDFPGGMRMWTDAKGKHQIKAKLIGTKGDSVVLKREDGEKITIPLEKLSQADQRFIQSTMPKGRGDSM